MGGLRRDKDLKGIAGEIGHKGDRRFVLRDDTSPVRSLSLKDVLKKDAPRFRKMSLTGMHFSCDRFEDEVSRVNLTVGVRV